MRMGFSPLAYLILILSEIYVVNGYRLVKEVVHFFFHSG
jgi:hypothetical protein